MAGAHAIVVGNRITATLHGKRVYDNAVLPADFYPELSLEQVAEGYRAMDERRAIKALLRT